MKPISVSDIQNKIQAQVANPEFASALLPSLKISGMASLKEAGPDDLTFFFSKNYQQDFFNTQSRLIVTGAAFVKQMEAAQPPAWKNAVILACENPYLSMAVMTSVFSPLQSAHDHQSFQAGQNQIHPTAQIAADVKLGSGVEIGAFTIIESGVQLADGVVIYPQCYIGKGVTIGRQSVLFPKVTLYQNTQIGQHCRIHAGSVIGADGFGYAPIHDPVSKKPVDHQKIYHLGNVVIGDHVEIGANSTIDRATFGSTIIHSKVKIDNQVQVGHNCEVGEGSILCGATGMAGSSSLGKFVVMLGQSGTDNQVHIGDYSVVLPYSGVTKDLAPDSKVLGMPARPFDEHFKIMAMQNKMLRERSKERKKS
jgi:UDP-3-O-[3-hydroxymyristoyl] glucosamine N-acyltransferase